VIGSCLCGAVAFELHPPTSPIELCHCSRCRKAYGSAFAATLYGRASRFRWTSGRDRVAVYDAPIRERPPAYRHVFCRGCGSALPIVRSDVDLVEVPAGAIDGDPDARPLRHVFVGKKAPWFEITDELPRHESHVERSEWIATMLRGWEKDG
jgi:hypothetical protein